MCCQIPFNSQLRERAIVVHGLPVVFARIPIQICRVEIFPEFVFEGADRLIVFQLLHLVPIQPMVAIGHAQINILIVRALEQPLIVLINVVEEDQFAALQIDFLKLDVGRRLNEIVNQLAVGI